MTKFAKTTDGLIVQQWYTVYLIPFHCYAKPLEFAWFSGENHTYVWGKFLQVWFIPHAQVSQTKTPS